MTQPSAATESRPWRVPMGPRDPGQGERAATPLELFFDLTFVVAVALLAAELAHSIEEGHATEGVPTYLMVFFAIWWAWVNFSWFASAYDCDDVVYRLLTVVQMGGVLVLAAGVHTAFEERDFTTVTLGYVLMRVAMLAQWLRAAQGDAERRGTALRYAGGIAVVQVGWVLRLLLPETLGLVGFLVLVAAEMLVPVWAERHGGTPWHPHHIAERYGLFTIIVLGEVVLAATRAVQTAVSEGGVGVDLVLLGAAALLLSVGLWWLYFLKSNGPALERRPDLSFLWGYGHYGVFASIAALGAGLEVAVAAVDHELEVSDLGAALAVAVPVAVFVLLVWALHQPLAPRPQSHLAAVLVTVAAVLALAVAVPAGLALTWAVLLTVVPVAALVAVGVAADHHRHAAAPPARMSPGS